MRMNLWLRFPKGTAAIGAIPKAEFVRKIQALQAKGLMLIHRENDEYEVLGLYGENWRSGTALVRQTFPEATRYQKV